MNREPLRRDPREIASRVNPESRVTAAKTRAAEAREPREPRTAPPGRRLHKMRIAAGLEAVPAATPSLSGEVRSRRRRVPCGRWSA